MATWAIGDVQGCSDSLKNLLQKIGFDGHSDRLWLVGDLVGRGPDPCGVLDLVISMGDRAVCVLGNHDLHLLAASFGLRRVKPKDRLSPILQHERRTVYINFLLKQSLIYYSPDLNCVMAHAGLYPWWSLSENLRRAQEVAQALAGPDPKSFFENMYGDRPVQWDQRLSGWDRLRFITNVFTRMRWCDDEGRLDLKHKGTLADAPARFSPWFDFHNPSLSGARVIFGHWSDLGIVQKSPYLGLDSGCIFGRCLSAVHLESEHVNII
ncbi:MAG: symmetrical bis(5'-nucleosyl)-tetraphosphatase, partial [Pseudomonadota bacterium]|nr:symmetrical bis(5'-nucleosyl)-tetraphosphatase [Pseudomonadota bacterium]